MRKIILCDFDGTITLQDTLVKILDAFAGPQWRAIEKKVKTGEMGNNIALREEFALCDPSKATKEQIIRLLNEQIDIDPRFKTFLDFCKTQNYEFMIISGGFSLCIDTILKKHNLAGLPYYSNKLLFEKDKLYIEYPYSSDKCSECGNCKTMHLERYRNEGYYIIYIGDGTTDKCPVKHADMVFAKEHLARYCEKQEIRHIAYETFADIQKHLSKNTQPRTAVWGIDTAGASLQSHNNGEYYE